MAQLNFRPVTHRTFSVPFGCALLLILFPAIVFGDEPQKNVLIFNSEDLNRPGSMLVNPAIRSTLKDHWKSSIQIYDEAQDSFRLPNQHYEAEMVKLLQRKYEAVNLDLIFALGTPALRFLLKHRGDLFTQTPIVFLVQDQSRIADLNLGSNVTGVLGKIEVAPTLDLALAFHPQTQRVVVVAGNAPFDQGLLALARRELHAYESRAAFSYLTGLTLDEVREQLAVLPENTIVIFLSFNSDRAGKVYTGPEALSLLGSSSAPIYIQSQIYLGYGTVGGRLLSYEALGLSAGQMGLRILAGESAQNIPPQTIPSVTMVDWRQLRRWGIDESKLPAGSIVRFKQPTLWEQYKWHIIGVASLIIFQALLIVWLVINQARRRRAEEASIASEERYRNVVETQTELICRYLPDSTLTFVNDAYCRYFGITREQLIGTKFIQLIPEPARDAALNHVASLIGNPRVETYEQEALLPNGETGWQQWTDHVVEINGDGVELQGIGRDITERKRAEQEMLQQRTELAHLSRVTMLGELSGSLAHELNQPLGAILRNTEAAELFLQEPSPDLEELRAILADIRKDDERAGAVIDRIHSLVKRREIEHRLLDLNVLASEVISLVRPDADSHKVRLALEPASSLPRVRGDRVQLQQVLLNLLLNAIQAVNDSPTDRRRVTVCVKPAGTEVEVAVSDTGHGIPTDKLVRLFEPFFTTKPNGMGMGLPISRTIMKAHHGSIRAENDPAGGATFCFTLPVAKEGGAS